MGNGLITEYYSTDDLRFQNRLKESMHEVIYMWLRADYNEREYKAKVESGEIQEDILSATTINSWQWWRPAIDAINIFAIVALSTWGLFVVINIFDPRKRY